MNENTDSQQELGAFGRIIGIFTSPTQTFQSIDRKPTWLIPFIITVIIAIVLQFAVTDIALNDRIAQMEAKGMTEEQIEAIKSYSDSPMKYIGLVFAPVGILIVWLVFAGLMILGGNVILGGNSDFKKVFSVVAWSYLITNLGGIIKTILTIAKGTSQGVMTSLAIVLPLPGWEEKPSLLYQFFSKLDVFTIWEIWLWILGLAIIYRFPIKKTASYVLSLWGIYIVISILIGRLFWNLSVM